MRCIRISMKPDDYLQQQPPPNVAQIAAEWAGLAPSQQSTGALTQLAMTHNCLGGKWMLWVGQAEADAAWKITATALVAGQVQDPPYPPLSLLLAPEVLPAAHLQATSASRIRSCPGPQQAASASVRPLKSSF